MKNSDSIALARHLLCGFVSEPGSTYEIYIDNKTLQIREYKKPKHSTPVFFLLSYNELNHGLSGLRWSRLLHKIQTLISKGELCPNAHKP